MTTALCEPRYADEACFGSVPILLNQPIATDTWRVRVAAKSMASTMIPGQFAMLRIDGCNDPLIGRAFAMYDRQLDQDGVPSALDFVYLVKGKFTQALTRCQPGNRLAVWGPLGNSFSDEPVDHLVMVAGGVGQTPMLTLGREALGKDAYVAPGRRSGYARRVTLCYGARSQDRLAGLEDFAQAGLELRLATEDGSIGGRPMRVTDQLEIVLAERKKGESLRIACCGPEPMMEAVAKMAKSFDIRCEVSLETPMACGIGICFTCVAKILKPNGEWDYQRTCVEGPVLDAAKIVW